MNSGFWMTSTISFRPIRKNIIETDGTAKYLKGKIFFFSCFLASSLSHTFSFLRAPHMQSCTISLVQATLSDPLPSRTFCSPGEKGGKDFPLHLTSVGLASLKLFILYKHPLIIPQPQKSCQSQPPERQRELMFYEHGFQMKNYL